MLQIYQSSDPSSFANHFEITQEKGGSLYIRTPTPASAENHRMKNGVEMPRKQTAPITHKQDDSLTAIHSRVINNLWRPQG